MQFTQILLDSFSSVFGVFGAIWEAVRTVWFIVFPLAFYFVFKLIWMQYVQFDFDAKIKWVMLEIIPPREVEKSPRLMESLFIGMAGVIKTPNAIEKYLKGYFPTSFSLEIVGDESGAHLYIRTPTAFRNLVEAHLYAQYPDVEIREVPDYVNDVPKYVPNKEWNLWGVDFELVKPDPYPIKTYRYFEEDVSGEMIDPLAGLIETCGKLPPGQKIWLQYIIEPEKEGWGPTVGMAEIMKLAGREKPPKPGLLAVFWQDIMDILKTIPAALSSSEIEFPTKEEKKDEQPLEFRLTSGEKDIIKALENNISKNVFNTKMRFIYVGKRDGFDKTFLSAFIGGLKQFADHNLNGFKPNDLSKTYANHLFVDSRTAFRQRRIFERYKFRSMRGVTFVMSTEELATVFHIPDKSVMAPALPRVDSKRGGAPINLPIKL